MAPTIIVGDDESAGDVAAKLLELADNQRQVKVRTDLTGAAYEVPDHVYAKYVGRRKRPDAEVRENAFAQRQAEADAPVSVTSDDATPDGAVNVDPDDVEVEPVSSDDVPPREAINVEPPSNGVDQGDQGDGDPPAATDQPAAPKKRASRARKAAAPRAAGSAK
jgi:hypothetical protein